MINNPTDSVCDYLAELLYEEVTDKGVPQSAPEASFTALKALDFEPQAHEPRVQSGRSEAKPKLPEFLEVPSFDKERLAKLLTSTPLKLHPDTAAAPHIEAEEPIVDVAEKKTPQHAVVTVSEVSSEPEVLKEIAWCENGRPSWAQERFDVLLFKVHGLTLAVPLVALGQIQPITDELTPLFGQAKWFMGLQPTPMGQIKTVNTALFVMPERYDPAFLASAKYVVSIDGLSWGLAVDSVQQPKTLDPDDVKWRQGRGLRPWLAGTIKEHMCALIDVPNMGVILAASDRNSKKG